MRTFASVLLVAASLHAGVRWETDLTKARERAVREDKLLFIEISTDW